LIGGGAAWSLLFLIDVYLFQTFFFSKEDNLSFTIISRTAVWLEISEKHEIIIRSIKGARSMEILLDFGSILKCLFFILNLLHNERTEGMSKPGFAVTIEPALEKGL